MFAKYNLSLRFLLSIVAFALTLGCDPQDDSESEIDGDTNQNTGEETDSASDRDSEDALFGGGDLPATLPLDMRTVELWFLDDGTQVVIPAYFESTGGVMIVGTADVEALRKLQRGMDDYSPVEASGRGLCFMWLFDYTSKSDLGAYKEVAFTHLAAPKGTPTDLDIDISSFESLMSNLRGMMSLNVINTALWLNSDLGIAAGEQIWGHPKLKAEFDETSEWREDVEVRRVVTVTESQTGRQVIFADLSFSEERFSGLTFDPQEAVTTGTWGDTNGPHKFITALGNVESISMKPWDTGQDKLVLGHGTQQLDMLQELDFVPVGIMYYGGFDLFLGLPADL